MKFKSKLLVLTSLFFCAVTSYSQVPPIRGEVSAGVYKNVAVDASGNLIVSSTTPQVVTVAPTQGTLTDRSGTVTLGGTAQTIMAANTSRKYLAIINTSDTDMWCNFTTTAVATQPSFKIPASAGYFMESGYVSTELVSCIGATTAKIFTAKEG